MKLIINRPYYYIESFDELELDEVADFLLDISSNKDNILFGILKKEFKRCDLKKKNFIKDRIYTESKEWLYPNDPPKNLPEMVWFNADDKEDIIDSIKIDTLFTCLIIKGDLPLSEASYILHVFEGIDFEVLCIEAKKDSYFEINLLSIFKNRISNISHLT